MLVHMAHGSRWFGHATVVEFFVNVCNGDAYCYSTFVGSRPPQRSGGALASCALEVHLRCRPVDQRLCSKFLRARKVAAQF
jgi:hypothetical protein